MSAYTAVSGNADLYGIGVRIGLYSQWVGTLMITIWDQESEPDARVANLIIQFAIFIGLCVEARGPLNSPVGSVITQFLLCGSLSSLTGDGISYFGHLSGLARTLFYAGLSSYGCWFYFTGIDQWMQHPDADNYANIAFFGPSKLDGWFRTAGKVFSCTGLAVSCAMLVWHGFAFKKRFTGRSSHYAPARQPKRRPQIHIELLFLSMGLIVLSITLIEYLIDANTFDGLQDVRSVGQFIPLLIGTSGAALTVWKIVVQGLLFKKRCWFLFWKHL